ncbi:MAG: family 20 glycosylhydrolase [Planctomycetota bacterium]
MKYPLPKWTGVMLDPGRVIENPAYYHEMLPRLAEWGYNLLHLHLIDDQRCALRFPSHPEIASPGAFSPEAMRALVAEAARHGIAVLPEIECLGHSARITGIARHRALAEPGRNDHRFNALCPAHPGTRKILDDLLRDTADIFPFPVLHAGLDEVRFGKCPRCRRAFGADTPDGERFARHAAWVHDAIRRLDRRPAMWADHVVAWPEMMKFFRPDVLMFHWHYNPDFEARKARALFRAGFETVFCPATASSSHTRIFPSAGNLDNLRYAASRAERFRRQGLAGFVNTVWCPWRYLPGAIDPGLAFAAHLFTAEAENPRFFDRFAAEYYDLTDGRRAGRALELLHNNAFEGALHDRVLLGTARKEPFGREDRRRCAGIAARVPEALALLRAARRGVRRNRARFDDILLSAEITRLVARFGAAGRAPEAARGAAALLVRAERAWNRERRPGDPMRLGEKRHGRAQSVIFALRHLSGIARESGRRGRRDAR